MMNYLTLVFAWLASPVHFVIWWPIFTGLCSLAYTQADDTKAGHKILSTLASLGLDLPKLLAIVKSFFGGGGSPDATKKIDVPSVPPRGTSVMRMGMLTYMGASLAAFYMISMCMLGACSLFTPKNTTDAAALVSCIVEDAAKKDDIGTIVQDCAGATIQVVEDIISSLLAAAQGDGGAPSALAQHYAKLLMTAPDAGAK